MEIGNMKFTSSLFLAAALAFGTASFAQDVARDVGREEDCERKRQP